MKDFSNNQYRMIDLPADVRKVAEKCNAPLCVLHTGTLWYPDEDICTCYRYGAVKSFLSLPDGNMPKWIKRQHNIKKKQKDTADRYFTYAMLSADRKVFATTKGINPDFDEDAQLDRFFKWESEEGR